MTTGDDDRRNDILRAESLADKVLYLVEEGQTEEASCVLREALSIAPENQRVREAFTHLQHDETTHPLLRLCRRYAVKPDEKNARALYQFLQNNETPLPAGVAGECITLLFERCTSHGTEGDKILSSLLRYSSKARTYLARQLEETTTDMVFEQFWDTGDESVNELVTVLLDASAWTSDDTRKRCEGDVFMLFVAKLMEAGQDHMERALKGIARLFLVDANRLHSLVDADGLEVILSSLDIRLPPEIRSQATVITAKYLEASQEAGEELLTKSITSRVTRATNDNLGVAFSVAAVVFPMVPSTATRLFLAEGFVESVVSSLLKKAKSTRVKQAALEMFSAACIDQNCRQAISKHCSGWLEAQVNAAEEPSAGTAALVLAKIRGADDHQASTNHEEQAYDAENNVDLVNKFKDMMMEESVESQLRSMEGLAYTSLNPAVKEELAHDKFFLTNLVNLLRKSPPRHGSIFGALTILVNITKYPPTLSEEEKHISQLKAYANTSKAKLEPDPLDDNEHATSRCKAVLDSAVVPVLNTISKNLSVRTILLITTLILSLSKEPKHRGPLAQQGAVKLLLHLHSTTTGPSALDEQARRISAHALARILISINPNLIFTPSSTPPLTSTIQPLLSLLSDDPLNSSSSEHRDLLPTFESLLALTNLCSTGDPTIHETLIRQSWPRIEDLLLSTSPLIQRATTELICNLTSSASGVAKFTTTDGNGSSQNKLLHILLALTDADDVLTRRAAGGALAMLTESAPAVIVPAVLSRDRGLKVLLGLLCADDDDDDDDDDQCRLRGLVCLANIIGQAGADGLDRIRREDGVAVLQDMMRRTRDGEVRELGGEVLRGLLEGS